MSAALLTRTPAVLDALTRTPHYISYNLRRYGCQRIAKCASLSLCRGHIAKRGYAYSLRNGRGKQDKKKFYGPTSASVPPQRDPFMFAKARHWAASVGIGTPATLRPIKFTLPPHLRGVGFAPKFSPLPTIRATEMPIYFAANEHPMSAYRMLKYERKLATDSFFLYIHVGVSASPIVRSYVERWIRNSIWAAMREKGYSNTGRVLPPDEMPKGIEPPVSDMCGTLQLKVTNPTRVVSLKRKQSLEIGRHLLDTVLKMHVPAAHPNRLLQPVQYPTDFLPHYKKKALLADIERQWEEDSKHLPRGKSVEERLADALAEKEKFFTQRRPSRDMRPGANDAVAAASRTSNQTDRKHVMAGAKPSRRSMHLAEEAELASEMQNLWGRRASAPKPDKPKSAIARLNATPAPAPTPIEPPTWDADEIEKRWNEAATPKTIRRAWKPKNIF